MNRKKILILSSLLFVSCTNNELPNTSVELPSASPSVEVTQKPSSTPSSETSSSTSPLPEESKDPEIVDNVPNIKNDGLDKVKLGKGYFTLPENGFIAITPFKVKTRILIEEKISSLGTLFSLFDKTTQEEHFSLSINTSNKLVVFAKNISKTISAEISDFTFLENKEYDLEFVRSSDKLEIKVDDKLVFSNEFFNEDFKNENNKRVLNIGANKKGENLLNCIMDYFYINDIISYELRNNFIDKGSLQINAEGVGFYQFLQFVDQKPVITPDPTPTPSAQPDDIEKEEIETQSTNGKTIMSLNVPKDLEEKIEDEDGNEVKKYGSIFTSPGFDFNKQVPVENDIADFRFITDFRLLDRDLRPDIRIAGNSNVNYPVYIIDLGPKDFDGVKDLSAENFEDTKQFYSSNNISSKVFEDHVYAIKTVRYGKEARYAKVLINSIRSYDYTKVGISKPEIVNHPAFEDSNDTNGFNNSADYQYYVSSYDGFGQTVPLELNLLSGVSDANNKKVTISFKIPRAAKGYVVYRKSLDNNKIFKIGPILANELTTVEFEDLNVFGEEVDQLPNIDNTVKSANVPRDNPKEIEFSYSFTGDNEPNFD